MVRCIGTVPVLLCFAASAQTPPATPAAFEVASIKAADMNTMSQPWRVGPETFIGRANLKDLITFAYDIQDYQLDGLQPWMRSELYDIQAKAPTAATPSQFKAMMRGLLTDRFHLRFAREQRTMSGYALAVDKKGPKLPAPRTDVAPESVGVIQLGGGEIWSRGSTLPHLAHALWLELQMPVIDETGIAGHYDFKLRFEEGSRELASDDADASPPGTGSIFTALREIGLRLDSRKLPVEVFRIDNADRPSEN